MGFGSVVGTDGERRHKTANNATITDVAATAPAPIIINVDCLCFSCLLVSVGGSSDKIVSSAFYTRFVCSNFFIFVFTHKILFTANVENEK